MAVALVCVTRVRCGTSADEALGHVSAATLGPDRQRLLTFLAASVTSLELSTVRDTLTQVDHASQARAAQISRFRQMTPGERWSAARDLYWSVRRLKEAFIRQQHPDWSNDQIAAAVREAFSHVRD